MATDVRALIALAEEARAVRRYAPRSAGVSAVEVSLAPGQMSPLHVDVADEAILVLDGALTLRAGALLRLEAGDRHVIPAGTRHAYTAGREGACILAVRAVRSAARYEEFVRAVGMPGGADDAGDLGRLGAVGAVNGITVLGSGEPALRAKLLQPVEA